MEVYVTKLFDRWCRKERLSDSLLCRSVAEMEKGLVDANLGLKVLAKEILGYDVKAVGKAVAAGALREVRCH